MYTTMATVTKFIVNIIEQLHQPVQCDILAT